MYGHTGKIKASLFSTFASGDQHLRTPAETEAMREHLRAISRWPDRPTAAPPEPNNDEATPRWWNGQPAPR